MGSTPPARVWRRDYDGSGSGDSLLVYTPRDPRLAEAGWRIVRVPPPAELGGYLPWCYEVRKDGKPFPDTEPFHYLFRAKEFVYKTEGT